MTIAKAQLIDALRLRYDHYSAATVFDIARQRVEIEDKADYSMKEVRSLRAAIELVGDRVGVVLAAVDEMLASGPAGEPGAAPTAAKDKQPKAEAAKAEVAKAEAAKAESAKAEAAKPEPAKTEAAKTEAAKPDKSEPPKVHPKTEKSELDKAQAKTDKSAPTTADVVEIVLKGLEVADGEQVMVCGAFEELGDWDPERARPMARKGDAWLTTVKLVPDATVAFKFLRRTADGTVIWETGDDRHLVAPRVEATWR